jgi:fructokinase
MLMKILSAAKANGALLMYDPNFRKAHLHELNDLKPVILENFRMADIVKGSDEDFRNVFGTETGEETYNRLPDCAKVLIYTKGKNGSEFYCPGKRLSRPAKKINPLSTIGAGDNFSAGIAYGLLKYNVLREDILSIPERVWENILNCGNDFASEVCLSYDNYISEGFARDYTI